MPVWLIVILILALIIAAVVITCICCRVKRTDPSCWARFRESAIRFWQAFFPRVTMARTQENLVETFRLVVGAMLLFGAFLIIWAIGAAVLRAGYLAAAHPDSVPALSKEPEQFPDTLWGWGFLVLETLRAVGGILVLCTASGLVGGLLGFLFGLPRPDPAGASGTPSSARRNWKTSTNLTEISDWLTKIIVGVGLVTATQTWGGVQTLADSAAGWLFNARHGSPAVITAALIGGAIFGFMFIYLYTQLIVSPMIAEADFELGERPDVRVTQTIGKLDSFDEALVPRISRKASGYEPPSQPTQEQLAAALNFRTVKLSELSKRADVRNWARARALLNDYRPAANAYAQLIGMPDDGTLPIGPDVLIEAARVMNAASDRPTEAAAVAELALSERDKAPSAEVKEAIIGDAAALRLSGRVPGGYEATLKLLDDYLRDPSTDKDGRLHLLRALAKGQMWQAVTAQIEKDKLSKEIMEDLRFALAPQRQRPEYVRSFWGPATPPNEKDLEGIEIGADIEALSR